MLTEKDYCDYETCVALRELGFTLDMTEKVYERNIMTNRYETIPKPSLYDAQKWLREERGINIFVMQIIIEGSNTHRYASYIQLGDKIWLCRYYSLYEEALLEGIKEAVKILKKE